MSAPMTLAAWVYVLVGRSEEPRGWSANGSREGGSGWLSSPSWSISCGPKDEVRGERIDGRDEMLFAEEAGTTAALAALATCRPVTIVGTSERTSLAKLPFVM